HRGAGNQATFDEKMRIIAHNLEVFAGAGLGLVGVDDEIMRPVADLLRHERPLHAGRKTGAAAPAQAGSFHLVDERIAAFLDDRLSAVPRAALARAFEAPVAEAVEVPENAVLVVEHFRP